MNNNGDVKLTMTLDEFRQENPEYKNWDDDDLAYGLHEKYYKDQVSFNDFVTEIDAKHLVTPVSTVDYDDLPPAGETQYDDLMTQYSGEYDIPESLFRRQMMQESNGDPNAVSDAGAKGLMQHMDATAADLGMTNPFDP